LKDVIDRVIGIGAVSKREQGRQSSVAGPRNGYGSLDPIGNANVIIALVAAYLPICLIPENQNEKHR
jgi:hypothetical protein